MFPLDDDTDIALRNQILLYHLSETLTDHERAKLLGLPEGCRIRERAKILVPENFKCGKNVWIGEGAILDAQGGLTIGDYSQIGLSVMIWSHTSHKQALISKTCVNKEGISYKPTKIGNNCFIGGPSVVAPGVTIGDRVIVSPLTFIDRDVPNDAVIGGNKGARQLEDKVQKLVNVITALIEMLKFSEKSGTVVNKLDEIMGQLQSISIK